MRQRNGVYTQHVNRSKGRVGHVFQGRYQAILVEKEAYLLALARYVVLAVIHVSRLWAGRYGKYCIETRGRYAPRVHEGAELSRSA